MSILKTLCLHSLPCCQVVCFGFTFSNGPFFFFFVFFAFYCINVTKPFKLHSCVNILHSWIQTGGQNWLSSFTDATQQVALSLILMFCLYFISSPTLIIGVLGLNSLIARRCC